MEPSGNDTIAVTLGKTKNQVIYIDRDNYRELFDNSIVYSLANYQQSLEKKRITFLEFVELARRADIPYTLFMAPGPFVKSQLKKKTDTLLAGSGKDIFSLNSRGSVELRDVELILKDILRKQTLPKKHINDPDNPLVGVLKGSKLSVSEQAAQIRELIGISLDRIGTLSKEKTFDYLVELLGEKNIFVSQSSKAHMPQIIQRHVRFSGMSIRDKKYPFIFLNNKDEESSFEPQGRKVLTLVLLLVCITKTRFAPVTYSERSKNLIRDEEFRIAEEVLMPESMVKGTVILGLDDIRRGADRYSVTPSAFLMRLSRLKLITRDMRDEYMQLLQEEFDHRKPNPFHFRPAETTAFTKYNSISYSKKIFELVDAGSVSRLDARRILLQNKAKDSFLDELRAKL